MYNVLWSYPPTNHLLLSFPSPTDPASLSHTVKDFYVIFLCDPQSVIRVACVIMGRGLFTAAWAT